MKPYMNNAASVVDPEFTVAEPVAEPVQLELFDHGFPSQLTSFPQVRFMGSKFRLLPWLHTVLADLSFSSAADVFSGSSCVGCLFKAQGKQVVSNDFLNLGTTLAKALIENPGQQLDTANLELVLGDDPTHRHFIEETYNGIFYTPKDLRFLDQTCRNILKIDSPYQ